MKSNAHTLAAYLVLIAGILGGTGPQLEAAPPAAPTINEPQVNGLILNPADVHMETDPFSDPDGGDGHFCTDWEVSTVSPPEVVWQTLCIRGLEAVHSHLGDGTFVGSHTGRTEFFHDTDYLLRARHRDDSAPGGGEWSPWSERTFTTGPPTEIFPLELDDILSSPTPSWTDPFGQPIVLPPSADQPSLRVETVGGSTVLEIEGLDGLSNTIINPPILPDHEEVLLRISAGDLASGVVLPESDLAFTDHEGEDHVIYLPSMNVVVGTDTLLWVTDVGATYVAVSGQTQPDFSVLARGVPVPWQVHQPGFKVEVVASGFQLPVNIAFVPNPGPNPGDPLYYVTELYGSVKVVTRNGSVSDYATNLLNFSPTGAFPGSGEQGLTGIVVEPTTGDVFVSLLYDAGGPHYPKVDRFTSLDGGLTAATQTTLLDMVGESQGQSHQISNLTLGPDGKLYVHMGDGFNASTAQDLGSFRGKILRLELDGSAPLDNPFYNAANGINSRDYVYSYGLRNPFGGAWRDADGVHYQVENGPSVDRFSKALAGQNYLWDGSNGSMTNFAIFNWNPSVGPTNIAFIQPSAFSGSLFPAAKMDHAFIADSGPTWGTGPQSNGKRIREYELDASGNLVSGPDNFVSYVGTGKATVVALAAGPDGLYFSDFYRDQGYTSPIDTGANILRIKFVGAADFSADVVDGLAPLAVQFSDASTVPSPVAWDWDFGDGTTSTGPNPSHVYTQDGVYSVRLSVTGANGVVSEEKPGFIRVGDFPSVGLIGVTLPPTLSDDALADHLRDRGIDVVVYDDEPFNRPSASVLAATHDLVIASSTISSANVAGEFRDEAVPLITWESALLRVDREPLAENGLVFFSATTIDVINNNHPITQNLALGLHDVFSSPAAMSAGLPALGAGSTVLATRAGAPTEATILVAEAGATLLGGHQAPARRVSLFLEDSSWLSTTPTGRDLVDRAVDWALGSLGNDADFIRGDCNGDSNQDISDPIFLLDAFFGSGAMASCLDACDSNDDGSVNIADAVASLGALFGGTGPLPDPQSCGSDSTADSLDCGSSSCP